MAGPICEIRLGGLRDYAVARMIELLVASVSAVKRSNGTLIAGMPCGRLLEEIDRLRGFLGVKEDGVCLRAKAKGSRGTVKLSVRDCIEELKHYYATGLWRKASDLRPIALDILLEFKEYARSWGRGRESRNLVTKELGVEKEAMIWANLAKTLTTIARTEQAVINVGAELPTVVVAGSLDYRGILRSLWFAARKHFSVRVERRPSSWSLFLYSALRAAAHMAARGGAPGRLPQLYLYTIVGNVLASVEREPIVEAAESMLKAAGASRRGGGRALGVLARAARAFNHLYTILARGGDEALLAEALLDEYSSHMMRGLLLNDPEYLAAAARVARSIEYSAYNESTRGGGKVFRTLASDASLLAGFASMLAEGLGALAWRAA